MGMLGQERSSQTSKPFICTDICGWNSWQDSLCCLWAAFVPQLLHCPECPRSLQPDPPRPCQAWRRHWPTSHPTLQHLPNTPKISNISNIPFPHILYGVTNLSMCCLSSSTLLLALPSKGSPAPARRHLLLAPAPGIGIFLLSIGFCAFPELPVPCLCMGSHLCHPADKGGTALVNFKGIFWLFPHRRRSRLTRSGPAGPWRPLRPGAAGPARPGRVCPSWAGWIFCTHLSVCEGGWAQALGQPAGSPMGAATPVPIQAWPGRSRRPCSRHELTVTVVLYTDQAIRSCTRVYPCLLGILDHFMLSAPLVHILLLKSLFFLPQGLCSS